MNILKIEKIIVQTLQDLIESLSIKEVDKLNRETVLFGDRGILDSMGLVSLITDLEEKFEQESNVSIILADERALSQKRSPFRTVSSLSEYIFGLIKERKQDEKD
jgi:acyl carrier protein